MTNEPKTDATDDQELANALAGIDETKPAASTDGSGLNFEETPSPTGAVSSPFGDSPVPPSPVVPVPDPIAAPPLEPVFSPVAPAPSSDAALDSIKKDALNELRPLVDKLSVPPEEKFDTYLLLLRSTDDTTLIGPAHDAAKEIPDEARRAQALLDVIKEIDYLSAHGSDK